MAIIAEHGSTFIIIAVIFGVFMTWGIGANDVANAMGTSVGSGALTVGAAIVVAAVFEFLGAALAGGQVTKTIRKGIIDPGPIADQPEILVFGMLAALLAAAVWLAIASIKGWPVSTTHSIVGAIVGFGMVGIGIEAVNWGKIGQIAFSWVLSPALGGIIAFGLMMSIRALILRAEEPLASARRWAPAYAFLVGFVMALVTLFKGLKHLRLDLSIPTSFLLAALFGLMVAGIGHLLIRRVEIDRAADRDFHFASVEKIFAPLMIFTACAMAFAHGSNDVANGIGPLAAVLALVKSGGDVTQSAPLPIWVLILGGGGIVLGLATYGYRVMQTIGKKITALTPSSGFCATMAAATTVVLASRTGLPVSTTHIAVGAVMGVGLARGFAALNLRVIGNILVSWVVTLPVGGLLAAFFFFTLKGIFT
ncbi:MAG: inorganic phosphate transporter [Pseudomonadota bacterium]